MELFEEEFAGNNEGTENERSMRAVHFPAVEVYLITSFTVKDNKALVLLCAVSTLRIF